MAELLEWLSDHRSALAQRSRLPARDQTRIWAGLPWWEFE